MPTEWSDDILMVDLEDEPALSEELNAVTERFMDIPDEPGVDGPHVVLNCVNLSYVNSSNIAQFLRLKKRLDELGLKLRLCGVTAEVWSVMQVTGLEKVFAFAPDPMTALAGLQMDLEGE